jgi:hypothetical protein
MNISTRIAAYEMFDLQDYSVLSLHSYFLFYLHPVRYRLTAVLVVLADKQS